MRFINEKIHLYANEEILKSESTDELIYFIKGPLYHEVGHIYSFNKIFETYGDKDFFGLRKLEKNDFVKTYKAMYKNYALVVDYLGNNRMILEDIAEEIKILIMQELYPNVELYKNGVYLSDKELLKEFIKKYNTNSNNETEKINIRILSNSKIKESLNNINKYKTIVIYSKNPILEIQSKNIPENNIVKINIRKVSTKEKHLWLKNVKKNDTIQNVYEPLKTNNTYKLEPNNRYKLTISVGDALEYKNIIHKDIIVIY